MSDLFDKPHRERQHSRSLFGPIVLISLGVYFLLRNLGIVSELNWAAAVRLWPLLLVFLGLNIIVNQVPRPLGSFLSALMGLAAVVLFGYVLFFGLEGTFLSRFNTPAPELQQSEVAFSAVGVETAVIEIDLGPAAAHLYALEDSRNLLEGSLTYLEEEPRFVSSVKGDAADLELSMADSSELFLNPNNWIAFDEADRWEIGLLPRVVIDLSLNLGTGVAELDLADLTLSYLHLQMGTGSVTAQLPDGDYDVKVEIGTGSTTLTLPQNGRHTIEIDGGTGSTVLFVPASGEFRIELDQGIGGYSMEDSRLMPVGNESGIWETADYGSSDNQTLLQIETGIGHVEIQPVR